MATRLDAAQSANATTLAYTVSAADNRRLVVFVGSEGTQSGQHTLTQGDQTGTHEGEAIAGSGTTQQTVSCFTFTEAQIEAASSNVLTAGNVPADFNISARSYQDCEQGALTNVDTDTTAAATPNPLAALDITTVGDDAIVAAFAGCGNATTTTWGGTVSEQTDQATGSAVGSMGDDEVPSATTIACEPTFASQNRAAGIAIGIEHLSSAGITSIDSSGYGALSDELDFDDTNVDVNGSNFGASEGTATCYLSPNDLLSEAGEVDISAAVSSWSDVEIGLDFSLLSQGTIDSLHTMGPGARFFIVDTDASDEYFLAITLHRPNAFQMVLGSIVPGGTTSRLTGMTGTFGGGRAEETAAQNPSTTTVNVADDGNREDVWSIEGVPNSVENDQYDFRALYDGAVADTITQTPQVTISSDAGVTLTADGGALALSGSTVGTVVSMLAVGGLLTLAGGSADFTVTQDATGGALSFNGGTATADVTMPATGGSLVFTGGTADPTISLPATGGVLLLAGGVATLDHDLAATSAGLLLSGGDADFPIAQRLTADGSQLTLTGGTADLIQIIRLTADGGSLLFTGGIALGGDISMLAEGSVLALTGGTADLDVTLSATGGSLNLTGGVANPTVSTPATGGALTLSGGVVDFGFANVATGGLLQFTGGNAILDAGDDVTILADGGVLVLAGGAATLDTDLDAAGGSLLFAGGSALGSKTMAASGGALLFTGGAAELTETISLTADGGVLTLAGGTASITIIQDANGGALLFTGGDADLVAGGDVTLTAEGGLLILTGGVATLLATVSDEVFFGAGDDEDLEEEDERLILAIIKAFVQRL